MSRPQSGADVAPVRNRAERADKARNRARILAAASEAFAERGVETQMDDIAARAGLGVGTLYRHFATKDALMVALVQRKFENILEVVQREVEREQGEPFAVFADVMREGASVAAADTGAQDALLHAGDAVWSAADPILDRLQAATQILIDRAQAAGTMRADVTAADIPMVMCGVSAPMAVADYDWRRYLDLVLDGFRASDALAVGAEHRPDKITT
jgi:AcrR family transcriptional regulator